MIVGFTGTRKGMTVDQGNALWALLNELVTNPWTAVHGDCIGADAEFHGFARCLGATIIVHPPTNKTLRAYCEGDVFREPQPYSKRNLNIVTESDLVIAAPPTFSDPGYGGTWQTIRFAQDADKLYRIIMPNGAVVEP